MTRSGCVGHIEFERCSDATIAASVASDIGMGVQKAGSTISVRSGEGAHLVSDLLGTLRRGYDVEARVVSEELII